MLIFYVMLMSHGAHEAWLPIAQSFHKERRRNSLNAKELALSKSTEGDIFSIMSTCVFVLLRFVLRY